MEKRSTYIWIIEGNFLGESSIPKFYRVGQVFEVSSLHFFCPKCGTDWAQVLNQNPKATHTVLYQPCRNCGGYGFLNDDPWHPTESFPPEVLERELMLAHKHPLEYNMRFL